MKRWIAKNYLTIFKTEQPAKTLSQFKQKLISQLNIGRSYLSDDDLLSISKLTSIGLSINDVLPLIENSGNHKQFADILNKLNKGSDTRVIFKGYLDNYLREHFIVFSNYLAFSDSLQLALTLKEEHRLLLKTITKKLVYPLGLLFISFMGIYIFNNYFFDSLMLTLNSLSPNIEYLSKIKIIIDIVLNFMMVSFLLFMVVILYFIKPRNYVLGYSLLCKYFKNNLFKRYITNELIVYFKEMYKVGLKTRVIFDNLKRIKSNPIIANIASNINDSLESGKTFIEVMTSDKIDKSFNRFVILMERSEDVTSLLDDYYLVNQNYFRSLINKVTRVVSVVSYGMIICFIFFIYQVILSPLNMLAGI